MKQTILFATNINKTGESGLVEILPDAEGMKLLCLCERMQGDRILQAFDSRRKYLELQEKIISIEKRLQVRMQQLELNRMEYEEEGRAEYARTASIKIEQFELFIQSIQILIAQEQTK